MKISNKKLENIYFDKINFGEGVRKNDEILSVYWPNGVYIKIQKIGVYHLIIGRDNCIFKHQVFKRGDDQLVLWVKRLTKDISDGKYSNKKTEREIILDIISKRNLTSYMNNTKWLTFRTAMLEEMPFAPPYVYKTLFDNDDYISQKHVQLLINNEGPSSFSSFDEENFNYLNYKAIEWVKIRPRFFTKVGGQLVRKNIWYDCEKELVNILKKHKIPYELENRVYTIYGYK